MVPVPVVTTGSSAANARSSCSSSASTTPRPHEPAPSSTGPKITIWPDSIQGRQWAAWRAMISRSSSLMSSANVGRGALSLNTNVVMSQGFQVPATGPSLPSGHSGTGRLRVASYVISPVSQRTRRELLKRELARGPDRHAAPAQPLFLATLMPDGSPQMTRTWLDTDGQHVVINTVQGHQKVKNV